MNNPAVYSSRSRVPFPFLLFMAFCIVSAGVFFMSGLEVFRIPPPEPDLFATPILGASAWEFTFSGIAPQQYAYVAAFALAGSLFTLACFLFYLGKTSGLIFVRGLLLASACFCGLYLLLRPFYSSNTFFHDISQQTILVFAVSCGLWRVYLNNAREVATRFDTPHSGRLIPTSVGTACTFCALALAVFILPAWSGLLVTLRDHNPVCGLEDILAYLPHCIMAVMALFALLGRKAGFVAVSLILGCWLLVSIVTPLLWHVLPEGGGRCRGLGAFPPLRMEVPWLLALVCWYLVADKANRYWFKGGSASAHAACSRAGSWLQHYKHTMAATGVPGTAILALAVLGYFILTGINLWLYQRSMVLDPDSPYTPHPFFTNALDGLCVGIIALWVACLLSAFRSRTVFVKLAKTLSALCPFLSVLTIGAQHSPSVPFTELVGPMLLGFFFQPGGSLVVYAACFIYFERLGSASGFHSSNLTKTPLAVTLFTIVCLMGILDYGAAYVLWAVSLLLSDTPPVIGQGWLTVGIAIITWIICPLAVLWSLRAMSETTARQPDHHRTERILWIWIGCLCILAANRSFFTLTYSGVAAFWQAVWTILSYRMPVLLAFTWYLHSSDAMTAQRF